MAGLEAEVAGARGEAKSANSDAEYFKLAGKVHEGVRISAEKLVGKLSGEKQVLQKEVERLVARKVLNGRDKGTRIPAPPGPPVCVGSGVQTEPTEVSVAGVQTDISRVQVVRETTYASVATQVGVGVHQEEI